MSLDRLNIIIGYRSRNEATVTLVKDDLILCGTNLDVTTTFQTHGNDKRVQLDQIAMEMLIDVHNANIKERTINNVT